MRSVFRELIRRFFEKTKYCENSDCNNTSAVTEPIHSFSTPLLKPSKETCALLLTAIVAVCCNSTEVSGEKDSFCS